MIKTDDLARLPAQRAPRLQQSFPVNLIVCKPVALGDVFRRYNSSNANPTSVSPTDQNAATFVRKLPLSVLVDRRARSPVDLDRFYVIRLIQSSPIPPRLATIRISRHHARHEMDSILYTNSQGVSR